MAYEVGGVTVQGDQPSNVINAVFGRKTTDGGKARIKTHRALCGLSPVSAVVDDLTMDHADNGMPSDSAYHAPDWDPA